MPQLAFCSLCCTISYCFAPSKNVWMCTCWLFWCCTYFLCVYLVFLIVFSRALLEKRQFFHSHRAQVWLPHLLLAVITFIVLYIVCFLLHHQMIILLFLLEIFRLNLEKAAKFSLANQFLALGYLTARIMKKDLELWWIHEAYAAGFFMVLETS